MTEPRVSDEMLTDLLSHRTFTTTVEDNVCLDLRDARAKLAKAERERDKAKRLFDECAIGRDAVGWLGHPADAIKGLSIECGEQRTRADRAEAALAQAGKVTEEMVWYAAVVVRSDNGCGLMVNGEHAFCDNPDARERRKCDCKTTARAALEAALNARKETAP